MSPAAPPKRRIPLVAILIGVVAVLLVGAIVVNALGSDDGGGTSDTAATGGIAEVRPVAVEGEAIAEFTGNGEPDAAVGTVAPTVEGANFAGAAESFGGQTGTPTLVVFVAHWCPHCQREVPRLVEWRADGTIPADIELVAVSTGVASDQGNYPPSAWLQEVGWPGRVLVDDADGSAAAAYGLTVYPYFVALDGEGNVVARGSGELDQASVEALVSQLEPADQ